MILPRDDFYLATCAFCDWFLCCNGAPFKAQREARAHARRNVRHHSMVLNMTRLSTEVRYYFEPLVVPDEPPF
jgi:hypothetical protein